MPQWAVNRGKTLVTVQVFLVLLQHLRGCIVPRNIRSYPFESYVTKGRSPRGASLPPTESPLDSNRTHRYRLPHPPCLRGRPATPYKEVRVADRKELGVATEDLNPPL